MNSPSCQCRCKNGSSALLVEVRESARSTGIGREACVGVGVLGPDRGTCANCTRSPRYAAADVQASVIRMQTARNIFPRRPEEAIQTLDNAIGSAEHPIDEGRRTIQDLGATVAPLSNLEYLLTVAAQELAQAPDSNGTHRSSV